MENKLNRYDLWWLFAIPLYQLIGTFRHEASHLIAALLEGARITEFVIWPTMDPVFRWGFVQWVGSTSWVAIAAPYFIDLATFAIFLTLCSRIRFRHWVWVNLLVIGLVSPFVNSLYNYLNGLLRGRGDVAWLLTDIPAEAVHLYLLLTMAFYLLGITIVSKGLCGRHRKQF